MHLLWSPSLCLAALGSCSEGVEVTPPHLPKRIVAVVPIGPDDLHCCLPFPGRSGVAFCTAFVSVCSSRFRCQNSGEQVGNAKLKY